MKPLFSSIKRAYLLTQEDRCIVILFWLIFILLDCHERKLVACNSQGPVELFLQTGYSVVSACVVTLRWKDKATSQVSARWISSKQEGIICLIVIALCGFFTGLCYRFNAQVAFMIVAAIVAILSAGSLQYRQVSISLHSLHLLCHIKLH